MMNHPSYDYTSSRIVREHKSEQEKEVEAEAALERVRKGYRLGHRLMDLADSLHAFAKILDAITKSLNDLSYEIVVHTKLCQKDVDKMREPMRITEESTTRVSTTKTSEE